MRKRGKGKGKEQQIRPILEPHQGLTELGYGYALKLNVFDYQFWSVRINQKHTEKKVMTK